LAGVTLKVLLTLIQCGRLCAASRLAGL